MVIILPDGLSLSIGNTASFIGLQIALVALFGAWQPTLRGLAGGLFILAAAAAAAALTGWQTPTVAGDPISWQIRVHVLISLFAYGLLSVGTIVALFALVQEKRLQARKLSSGQSAVCTDGDHGKIALQHNGQWIPGAVASGVFGSCVRRRFFRPAPGAQNSIIFAGPHIVRCFARRTPICGLARKARGLSLFMGLCSSSAWPISAVVTYLKKYSAEAGVDVLDSIHWSC